ncbi:XTP/dITP diphosphatase [bacterium]|nr:XTP/dITP diphosphatase [bacterium]
MDIVLATRNKDKIKEIKKILRGLSVNILTLDEFPAAPQVEEDGNTLEENATKKALEIAIFTKKIALADDSGLEVEALNGKPGVYSARFAGEEATYEDNNKKLLQLLKHTPPEKRKAQFKCVIAIVKPIHINNNLEEEIRLAKGICSGFITQECKGKAGFGYDPIFFVPEYGRTFAEMDIEEKNKISHRAKALQSAKKMLQSTLFEIEKNSP